MGGLHAALALAVLGAGLVLMVGGVMALWRDAWHDAVRRLGRIAMAIFAFEAGVGTLVFLGGSSPRESLHLLYGAAQVAVIPLASTFAAEAPPRARSGVLAAAGMASILLTWRLFATG